MLFTFCKVRSSKMIHRTENIRLRMLHKPLQSLKISGALFNEVLEKKSKRLKNDDEEMPIVPRG
jgi:hypothetical protein